MFYDRKSNVSRKSWKSYLSGVLVSATLLAAPQARAADPETAKPVRIVVTGITDADFIANVFGGFLEQQGYKVERVKADYAAQFVGLEAGDMDFSTSIWDTSRDIFDASLATGKVQNMGSTGVKVREGWWYPLYVKELCPGLPDWKALLKPACVKALSTVETAPKGRFIEAPADWTTNNAARLEALKLPFALEGTGTPAALHAAIVGAVQRKEPVIGWGFMPDWMTEQYPGEFVKFPEFEAACATDPKWGSNPDKVWDCDNPFGYVWKVSNTASEKKFPRAARMLRIFHLTAADVAWGIRRVDVDGVESEKAAAEWLKAHPELVADWAL